MNYYKAINIKSNVVLYYFQVPNKNKHFTWDDPSGHFTWGDPSGQLVSHWAKSAMSWVSYVKLIKDYPIADVIIEEVNKEEVFIATL